MATVLQTQTPPRDFWNPLKQFAIRITDPAPSIQDKETRFQVRSLVAILVFKARQWFASLFTGRPSPEPPARQDRKVIDVQYEIVDRRKDDVPRP